MIHIKQPKNVIFILYKYYILWLFNVYHLKWLDGHMHSSNKVFFSRFSWGNGHFQPTSLLQLCQGKSGNGHFQLPGFFCHFALSENKAGTVTAEGILIFAVVKWSVVALNQQCLSVLILQMTTFNQ